MGEWMLMMIAAALGRDLGRTGSRCAQKNAPCSHSLESSASHYQLYVSLVAELPRIAVENIFFSGFGDYHANVQGWLDAWGFSCFFSCFFPKINGILFFSSWKSRKLIAFEQFRVQQTAGRIFTVYQTPTCVISTSLGALSGWLLLLSSLPGTAVVSVYILRFLTVSYRNKITPLQWDWLFLIPFLFLFFSFKNIALKSITIASFFRKNIALKV